jgi:arabinogalactan endo-1,4-beta-galactosidase
MKRFFRDFGTGLLAFVSLSSVAAGQSENLLSNPSFEDGSLVPWHASGEIASATVTESDSVDGAHALAIASGGRVTQQLALSAGVYELRAFVRTGKGQIAQVELSCKHGPRSKTFTNTPDPSSPTPIDRRNTDWQELHAPAVFLTRSSACEVTIQVTGKKDPRTFLDSTSLTRHENLLRNPQLLRKQEGWKIAELSPASNGTLLSAHGQAESESSLFQTVELPPGDYTLAASYRSSGGQSLARLEAKGCGADDAVLNLAPAPYGEEFRRVKLRGISVSNVQCEVGLRVHSSSGQWLRVSDLTLESDSQPYHMVAGGDVSLTDMVEEQGGAYRLHGVASDPFLILASNGMSLARLHLFVDPGNPDFLPSRNMRGTYADLSRVLRLAKRAHLAGMKIELALHLSDYWADGGCQTIPHAWLGLGPDALVSEVSAYISNVLRESRRSGIPVDYIAIGNEADSGLLRTKECKSALLPVNADARANPDLLAQIYEAGYRAVREASPESVVIWHLANIGRYAETRWYLDSMFARGAHVDALAFSAYPFWSRQTVRQFQDFANYVTARYHRPVFFEETAYPWAPAAGADNMKDGGPEPYALTPRGQLDFLNDEISAIESADDGEVIGFSYWDATWIPAPGAFDNVDNYVLFDRSGNALPALTIGYRSRIPH